MKMKVDLFDFDLPRDLIAQRPASPRDSSRLLVVGPKIADRMMGDLPQLLKDGDLLVFNNTRVIPTRLKGRRAGAKVEVTLHKRDAPGLWRAFARPAKKLKADDTIDFAPGLAARVAAKGEGGEVTLDFARDDDALSTALERHGAMPLPPYIKRDGLADAHDGLDYQTMFAEHPGAVAAPTAALHFTPDLMAALKNRGVKHAFLTLHVGAGTYLPVISETTEGHAMHSESGELPAQTCEAVNRARAGGGRVVAVGSTALRLLEAAAREDGTVAPFSGATDIFITPGYRFKTVDLMLTNFHLPRSTLFMLVAAFVGLDPMKQAYQHAMDKGYRFYSYGDACLLERGEGT